MTNLYAAVEDKVATVFFNGPPLNLFTLGVFDELERMFTSLEKLVNKDEVRSVVLTSSVKKAFSAGDDVNEGPQISEEAIYENTVARAVMDKILNFPIPVIATVDSYALGGGLVLAMIADYVIAGEHAKFGFTEINFGMFANWGTTYTLGKGFSIPHMKHLMFSGETFGADEALSMNIVQKVVAPDELLSCAQAQAKLYASKAPIFSHQGKRSSHYEKEHCNVFVCSICFLCHGRLWNGYSCSAAAGNAGCGHWGRTGTRPG